MSQKTDRTFLSHLPFCHIYYILKLYTGTNGQGLQRRRCTVDAGSCGHCHVRSYGKNWVALSKLLSVQQMYNKCLFSAQRKCFQILSCCRFMLKLKQFKQPCFSLQSITPEGQNANRILQLD